MGAHSITLSVEAQRWVLSTVTEVMLVTEGALTGKGDVEAPLPCGVVSLEL